MYDSGVIQIGECLGKTETKSKNSKTNCLIMTDKKRDESCRKTCFKAVKLQHKRAENNYFMAQQTILTPFNEKLFVID